MENAEEKTEVKVEENTEGKWLRKLGRLLRRKPQIIEEAGKYIEDKC